MSIVEINTDVRLLTKSLDRIATALEQLLLHAYGIDLRNLPVMEKESGTSEASISYANDESSAIAEANDELERLGARPHIADEV